MVRKLLSINFNLFILVFFSIYIVERFTGNNELMFICGLFALVLTIAKNAATVEDNIGFILFLFSCFLFMQGLYLINILIYGQMNSGFSEVITTHINDCIVLSIAFLNIGYYLGDKFVIGRKKKYHYLSDFKLIKIRKVSLILFYAAASVFFVAIIDTIIFVRENSYLDYYLSYSSHLPRLLQVFGNMYLTFFILYMASYPNKDACAKAIKIYLLLTVLLLLSGDRGGFIQNIGILIVYCFWRQKADKITWIKPIYIYIGCISLPFLMAFLSFFVSIREGIDVGEANLFDQLQRFIGITGRSASIIGYGKQFQGQFPQHWYSIGGIIDYIKYNPIVTALGGYSKPATQTAEYALTMHSFDSILSYLIYPQSYYNGHGVGSSYIAEVYNDFGYIGVALINVLYGIIFKKCKKIHYSSPYKFAILLLMVRSLYYTPRGPAVYFITSIVNITTITAFLMVYILTKINFKIYKLDRV